MEVPPDCTEVGEWDWKILLRSVGGRGKRLWLAIDIGRCCCTACCIAPACHNILVCTLWTLLIRLLSSVRKANTSRHGGSCNLTCRRLQQSHSIEVQILQEGVNQALSEVTTIKGIARAAQCEPDFTMLVTQPAMRPPACSAASASAAPARAGLAGSVLSTSAGSPLDSVQAKRGVPAALARPSFTVLHLTDKPASTHFVDQSVQVHIW